MTNIDAIPPIPIAPVGPASRGALEAGLTDLRSLAAHLLALPYGRAADRADLMAPLREMRGTCSSKHALLALVAREQKINLGLTLCIYEMSAANTPAAADALARHGLESIPEAHCCVTIGGRRVDITGLAPSATDSPFDALLSEERIEPEDVVDAKPARHRAVLDAWAARRGYDPAWVWMVREECIAALSGLSPDPAA